ncbi:MAG: type VI secretion system ImpA family N-terminal domain-containing protein, partial [Desulfovibrionaceae bacterium]|nr:type VI secretion system ImpA family N-terminal domain-containing protein [Desulfovibrionaceae bacterium]
MDLSSKDIASLVAAPIPGDSPSGIEARYEPEYAALLEEIEKLTALGHTTECNWQVVLDMGLTVLRDKSKDFQAACYTANALSRLHGLEGMADGCLLLRELTTRYWETGFPVLKRLRRRVNAFTWWRDCTEALLQTMLDSTPVDRPFPHQTVDHLLEELQALDSALGEAMPDFPPMRSLAEMIRRLPATQPEPEPAAVEPQPAPSEAAPQPAADSPAGSTGSSPASQPVAPSPERAAAPVQTATPQQAPAGRTLETVA